MKKRNLFIVGAFALLSAASYAQVSGGLNDGTSYGFTLIPTISNDNNEIVGSPYLNEDFTYGTLTVEGKEPLNVFMRYNVAEEQVEIKFEKGSDEIHMLPYNQKTIYNIGGQDFILDRINSGGEIIFGYFIEKYDGDNFRLLKKPSAKVTEGEVARTGYGKDKPARIQIEEEYYLVEEDGRVQNLNLKHRQIKRAFESEKAKSYLNRNKIRTEEDLVSFVSYLDKQ